MMLQTVGQAYAAGTLDQEQPNAVTTHLHVTAKRAHSKEEATSRTGKVSRYRSRSVSVPAVAVRVLRRSRVPCDGWCGPIPGRSIQSGSRLLTVRTNGCFRSSSHSRRRRSLPDTSSPATNNGAAQAADVLVQDPTPTGLAFVSNGGACTTPFACALGPIPAGQSRTITSTFSVPSGYAGPNPIVNTATVGSSTADANTANNAATVRTPVQGAYVTPPEDNQDKQSPQQGDRGGAPAHQHRQPRRHLDRGQRHRRRATGRGEGPAGHVALTRNETQVVQVPCDHGVCPDIRVGNYLEADGYQNGVGDPNNYFVAADGVTVWRGGKKVT